MHNLEWIKVKHSTDFSTPLSKKVVILLNRAIREEKEEKVLEHSQAELSMHNGDDGTDLGFEIEGDDWHPTVKQEETTASSGTPPQSRRQRKIALERFQDGVPSPYSPTSFSKVLPSPTNTDPFPLVLTSSSNSTPSETKCEGRA